VDRNKLNFQRCTVHGEWVNRGEDCTCVGAGCEVGEIGRAEMGIEIEVGGTGTEPRIRNLKDIVAKPHRRLRGSLPGLRAVTSLLLIKLEID
jgi:hypothetical protein